MRWERALRAAAWVAAIGLGVVLRLHSVALPFDARTPNSWREGDYTAIARAFHRESMNPLCPRVAWRGDSAGCVEAELPVLPWVAAALYRVFGEHEQVMRVLSAAAGIATLLAFASLARRTLAGAPAWVATAAFALSPLPALLSGSMQPEPLMLLLVVLAVSALWRWGDRGGRGAPWAASGLLSAAVLAKAPALHLGPVFAWEVLRRRGLAALRDPALRTAGLAAALLPLAWYGWAHLLYLDTGLSLGVSNETHWITPALLRHPKSAVLGNVRVEALLVFSLPGLLLAACALLRPWREIERLVVWYVSVVLFDVLFLNTTGDDWAAYYHGISAPAASLLLGAGYAGVSGLVATPGSGPQRPDPPRPRRLVGAALAAATLAGLAVTAVREIRTRPDEAMLTSMQRCARELATHVPAGDSIVVRGGRRTDWLGQSVAWNEPMLFAWMDRHGFSYPTDELRVELLDAIAKRGGRYWVAQPGELEDEGLRRSIAQRYPRVAECEGFALFVLDDHTSHRAAVSRAAMPVRGTP
jgi:hypothetical protein